MADSFYIVAKLAKLLADKGLKIAKLNMCVAKLAKLLADKGLRIKKPRILRFSRFEECQLFMFCFAGDPGDL